MLATGSAGSSSRLVCCLILSTRVFVVEKQSLASGALALPLMCHWKTVFKEAPATLPKGTARQEKVATLSGDRSFHNSEIPGSGL
jgi:hypothetical protein